MTCSFRSESPSETVEYGKKIGALLRGGDIIAFRGGLGAGKTAMTRGIALGMGLRDDVSSPTFAIVNEYEGSLPLLHFDMYRLSGGADLESIGFYDYLSDRCVMAIEWSENIEGFLPPGTTYITIEPVSENERKITIEGDERFDIA